MLLTIWRQKMVQDRKIIIILISLLLLNIISWIISISLFNLFTPQSIPILVLAYILGLRHALDPDHLAAIDNVTRKLIYYDQKPISVGLWFSLGHSTVVVIY